MSKAENTRKDREDIPRDLNHKEVNFEPRAKKIKAQKKIDIHESELGRALGQKPADEHIEDRESQIDPETTKMQQQQQKKES